MRHKRKEALKESDLVVLCGVAADFRLDYGSQLSRTEVISVNLSEKDLRKNRKPELAVNADPQGFLVALSRVLPAESRHGAWIEKLRVRDGERDAEIVRMAKEPVEHLNPIALCQSIDEHLSDDCVLIGDGGDFVATASYTISPRKPYGWLDPGVFGTLGVGAGFAIGAKLVNPSSDVWLLYGDGAAGFSAMEMDTCARHGINVIAVVGNDAGWTQIERDQVAILADDVGCRLSHMDYHKVAEGCGAKGLVVSAPDQMNATLEKAIELSRAGSPVLVNALIGKTEFRKGSISM
jgi:acetolactate synthase-1/2/3 large subunit